MRRRHHVLLAHLGDPLDRRVPVVVDVVVVEDHRARDRREQPADHRLAPRGDVELHVVVVALDEPVAVELVLDVRVDLVGVDLVAEQQQRVRPLLRRERAPCAARARAARRPRARRGARPCAACAGGSCGAATRQEPKTIRTGSSSVCVRRTLGGNRLSGSGQTTSPSSATSYGVAVSAGSSVTWTSA